MELILFKNLNRQPGRYRGKGGGKMIRTKAILKALYFGIMPYWVYEDVRHYDCSYWQHLAINIQYAWRWVTYSEYESDRQFELKTNNNGKEAGSMKVKFILAWYDLWVGCYWDKKRKWLYILPLPCIGIILQFKQVHWVDDNYG